MTILYEKEGRLIASECLSVCVTPKYVVAWKIQPNGEKTCLLFLNDSSSDEPLGTVDVKTSLQQGVIDLVKHCLVSAYTYEDLFSLLRNGVTEHLLRLDVIDLYTRVSDESHGFGDIILSRPLTESEWVSLNKMYHESLFYLTGCSDYTDIQCLF